MVNCTAFASVHYDLRLALFKFVTLAKQVLHRMNLKTAVNAGKTS
jgi:hypothetical protein